MAKAEFANQRLKLETSSTSTLPFSYQPFFYSVLVVSNLLVPPHNNSTGEFEQQIWVGLRQTSPLKRERRL